jgi:cytochrome c oxidase subunit 3
MLFGAVLWMDSVTAMFLMGFMKCCACSAWWSDVIVESHQGDHASRQHQPAIRVHYVHHVEIMFFAAWFWSFFKHAMYPMGPQYHRRTIPAEAD